MCYQDGHSFTAAGCLTGIVLQGGGTYEAIIFRTAHHTGGVSNADPSHLLSLMGYVLSIPRQNSPTLLTVLLNPHPNPSQVAFWEARASAVHSSQTQAL